MSLFRSKWTWLVVLVLGVFAGIAFFTKTPAPDPRPQSAVTAHPSPTSSATPDADTSRDGGSALVKRVIDFEIADNSRYTDDTNQKYLKRIRPFVSTEYLEWAFIDVTSPSREGGSIEVTVAPEDVLISPTDATAALATARLHVKRLDKADKTISDGYVTHTTSWGLTDGTWLVYPPP